MTTPSSPEPTGSAGYSWENEADGPLTSPDRPSKKRKTLFLVVGAIIFVVGGIGVLHEFVGSKGKSETHSSAAANPNETVKFSPPETPHLSESLESLENIHNTDKWRTALNETLMPQMNWYLDELVKHPTQWDKIPTKSFTSSNEIVLMLQSMAQEILDTKPKSKSTPVVSLGSLPTSNGVYDPNNYSGLVIDAGDNQGMSYLKASYHWDHTDTGGNLTQGNKAYLMRDLNGSYKIIEADDGEVHIDY